MIPFFNYAELYNQNKSEYLKIIEDVCSRGAFILQSDLEEFEKILQSLLMLNIVLALPMVLMLYGLDLKQLVLNQMMK